MAAGALLKWRAMLIARETACLDPRRPRDRGRRARRTRPATPERQDDHRFEGWGDRRLIAEVDRHVTLRPARDTMARLSLLLPAATALPPSLPWPAPPDTVRPSGDLGAPTPRPSALALDARPDVGNRDVVFRRITWHAA